MTFLLKTITFLSPRVGNPNGNLIVDDVPCGDLETVYQNVQVPVDFCDDLPIAIASPLNYCDCQPIAPPVPSPTTPSFTPPTNVGTDTTCQSGFQLFGVCVCFSGHLMVDVQGKGLTRMDHLQIGDNVLSADGIYSRVYSFGHKAMNASTKYLQVYTETMDTHYLLEISLEHLVFFYDKMSKTSLVPAGELKVGDQQISSNGGPSKITAIHPIRRKGAYSPLTTSGNLVVNGIVASNYVTGGPLLEQASSNMLHHLQHGGVLPYQMYCYMFGCDGESYNEIAGFSVWVQFWYNVGCSMLEWPKFFQHAFLLLLILPAVITVLLRHMLTAHAMITHLLISIVGYMVWKAMVIRKKPGETTAIKK